MSTIAVQSESWPARVQRGWNDFFHAPANPYQVALMRIAYGLIAMVYFYGFWPHLTEWFGEQGILPHAISRQTVASECWSLLAFVKTDSQLTACLLLAIVQSILLAVGFLPRFQALSIFVWGFSFQHRNSLMMDSEDIVFRLMGFYMIWLPLGEKLSINRWLKSFWQPALVDSGLQESPRYFSAWPLRMMQIQMVVIMASAAGWKLSGEDWRSGEALYYVCRLDDLFGRFPVPDFLFEIPILCRMLTWTAIAIELFTPIFIWFPSTRRWTFLVLLIFHFSTDYMMHLFLFHWVMLLGWMAFLQPEDYRWLIRLLTRREVKASTPLARPV